LVTYSENFSQWAFVGNATQTPNYSTSPSNLNNATMLNVLSGYIRLSITGKTSSSNQSIFVKKGGSNPATHIRLTSNNTSSWNTGSSLKYELTDDWTRINVQDGILTSSAFIIVGSVDETNTMDSDCNGTSLIWGAQVEDQSYPTSYIPTNGSTVTRLKDAAFGSGNSDLINSTEGVLYFEGSALTNETDVNKTIGISNVSSSNRVQLTLHGTPSRISFYGTSSEGFALSYSNFSYNKTEPLKIAVKWKIGDVGIFINGIKVYTGTPANTFLSNTLNTLSFADYNNVGSPFYGKTKCLAVFKEALTDEELECLTTDETSYSSFTALALANNYTII
jgi:hypothetical protein